MAAEVRAPGPVLVKKILEPFLPIPVLVRKRRAVSRWTRTVRNRSAAFAPSAEISACWFARWRILWPTDPGIRQATEDAVLNANYVRKKLEDVIDLPYDSPSMHEVVFSDARQKKHGVNTMDIAKRLIDYGFHPYTTAFPLIVPGALMIEPTESESKEECDLFIDAMRSIARGSRNESGDW